MSFPTMTAAVKIPVTVKIRAGWDEQNINAEQIVKIAEAAGAKAICIHGRTRQQGYRGPANWDYIKACKQAATTYCSHREWRYCRWGIGGRNICQKRMRCRACRTRYNGAAMDCRRYPALSFRRAGVLRTLEDCRAALYRAFFIYSKLSS